MPKSASKPPNSRSKPYKRNEGPTTSPAGQDSFGDLLAKVHAQLDGLPLTSKDRLIRTWIKAAVDDLPNRPWDGINEKDAERCYGIQGSNAGKPISAQNVGRWYTMDFSKRDTKKHSKPNFSWAGDPVSLDSMPDKLMVFLVIRDQLRDEKMAAQEKKEQARLVKEAEKKQQKRAPPVTTSPLQSFPDLPLPVTPSSSPPSSPFERLSSPGLAPSSTSPSSPLQRSSSPVIPAELDERPSRVHPDAVNLMDKLDFQRLLVVPKNGEITLKNYRFALGDIGVEFSDYLYIRDYEGWVSLDWSTPIPVAFAGQWFLIQAQTEPK
ncbi:hypothetical protein H0H93_005978 [Arthromyces matolae]|nr:hypothetical protein H0H93_005978 [Arthromyces matolae]